ncbi:hypothetical protein F5884DRAFT_860769 [Xylogone sp. PMI_703]|nr:hypothetical protein F5884DRAFT_860769 [Xylogone sp. PMI_703]
MHFAILLVTALPALSVYVAEQFPLEPDNVSGLDKFNPLSCKDVCPIADRITNDRKHMKKTWAKIEVDGWFQTWLKSVPYHKWPNHIAKYIWPKQASDLDCTSLQGTCKPLDNNCYYLCHGNVKQPAGWFLSYAAEMFQHTSDALHEFYQDLHDQTEDHLHEIISDWDGGTETSEDAEVMSIISASLGVAAGVIGASTFPGAAAAEKLLNDVFGGGNAKDIPKSALRHPYGSLCDHNVCKFFAAGKWFFHDIDEHIHKFKRETRKRLDQALGIFAMNNKINVADYGYLVLINTDVDKEDCGSENNVGHWTRGQCFNLFWYRIHNNEQPGEDAMYLWNVGHEWLHKFHKYGLSLDEYYNNVWDCATSHAVCHKKDHRAKWTGHEHGLPRCLFHTKLVKGSYDATQAKMASWDDPCDEA